MSKRIVFHVGGPDFHPVRTQAEQISRWLGNNFLCEAYDGRSAFEHISQADLLVIMGLHWTGWANDEPLGIADLHAFESYVRSGRPIIAHHGGIASYDDSPEFGELLGFRWIWGQTNHSPIADYDVRVLPTNHPIVSGLRDFRIHDELYYDVAITSGLSITTHAHAEFGNRRLPMVMTATRGGTGRGRKSCLPRQRP